MKYNKDLSRCFYDIVPGTISLFPVWLFVKLAVWKVKKFIGNK